jgi:hypothetical protein
MKKTFLILAGCAIFFASCDNKKAEEPAAMDQRVVDSIANAAAAAKEAEINAANDSMAAAAMKAKADSEAIANEAVAKDRANTKKTSGTKKVKTPPPPPPPPAPAVEPANPKASRFSEKVQDQVQKANTEKKAERFK